MNKNNKNGLNNMKKVRYQIRITKEDRIDKTTKVKGVINERTNSFFEYIYACTKAGQYKEQSQ